MTCPLCHKPMKEINIHRITVEAINLDMVKSLDVCKDCGETVARRIG